MEEYNNKNTYKKTNVNSFNNLEDFENNNNNNNNNNANDIISWPPQHLTELTLAEDKMRLKNKFRDYIISLYENKKIEEEERNEHRRLMVERMTKEQWETYNYFAAKRVEEEEKAKLEEANKEQIVNDMLFAQKLAQKFQEQEETAARKAEEKARREREAAEEASERLAEELARQFIEEEQKRLDEETANLEYIRACCNHQQQIEEIEKYIH